MANLQHFINSVKVGADTTGVVYDFYIGGPGPLCLDVVGAAVAATQGHEWITGIQTRMRQEDIDTGLIGAIFRSVAEEHFPFLEEICPIFNTGLDVRVPDETGERFLIDENPRTNFEKVKDYLYLEPRPSWEYRMPTRTWEHFIGLLWETRLFKSRIECAEFVAWLYISTNS